MLAYFVTSNKNVNINEINCSNTIYLSKDKDKCIEERNRLAPNGLVVSIDIDEKDAVETIMQCMIGNSHKISCKVIQVID